MAHEIFISYSAKNKAIADAVCSALEVQNIGCWIAPRDVTPGIKYAEAIVDAINNCKIFLLVLSEASNRSNQVEMEVDRAVCKDIPILSFRIESVVLTKTMEYYLSSFHWLDAIEQPIERHLQVLVQTVRNLLTSFDDVAATELAAQVEEIQQLSKRSEQVRGYPVDIPTSSKESDETINPFSFGNPIKDPKRFIGREIEIRQIRNRLLSSAHESTSVIGERRIGKTSLLYHLAHPEVSAHLGLSPDKFCIVYVDFQGLTDITPARFWQQILKKMSRSISDKSLVPLINEISQLKEFDLFDLEDVFQEVADRGMTTVLLMDEFEYVTLNPNFKGDFFGALRALAIHHGVALVPATRRELVDLCYSDEIKGSPFFNIFANLVLRPFTRAQQNEMLDLYLEESHSVLSLDEKDFIWNISGGYPFFVQMAGNYFIEGKLQGKMGKPLKDFIDLQFDEQAEPHFSYLWSHCTASEQITLLVILTLNKQQSSEKETLSLEYLTAKYARAEQDLFALGKRGLVIEDDMMFSIFSKSFSRWIKHELHAMPGDEESQTSVDEWVRAGGLKISMETAGVFLHFKKRYWPIISEFIEELTLKSMAEDAVGLLLSAF